MSELRITIPLEPPTANHYVKHTRSGRHYVTAEAKTFKRAVAVCAMGIGEVHQAYEVWFTVFQGKGSRGDCDNYSKVLLDSLVDAKVIHSDAAITDLHISKRRDPLNPRTEVVIREAARA